MSYQICCPQCNSNQIYPNKKGFSAGKALVGSVLFGNLGLLAGFHKSGDIEIACLACGHEWNPKKLREQALQNDAVNKNPVLFIIFFLSLFSAVFIPLAGGSWWFLLIMPIVGIVLVIIAEIIKNNRASKSSGNKPVYLSYECSYCGKIMPQDTTGIVSKNCLKCGAPLKAGQ